jgi:hypothetical protein
LRPVGARAKKTEHAALCRTTLPSLPPRPSPTMAARRALLRFSPLAVAAVGAPLLAGGAAAVADPEAARVAAAVPARLARSAAAAAAIVAGRREK